MKKSKIVLLNDEFRELMEKSIVDDGEILPTIGIIAEKINETDEKARDHLMICPLPSSLLKSDDTKLFLMEDILPKIGQQLLKGDFTLVGCVFAYLGMVRTISKEDVEKLNKRDEDITLEDMKDVKPKEILFFHYESDEDNMITAFNVSRKGKAVNEAGELIDIVKLTKNHKLSAKTADEVALGGPLSRIYKKLKQSI